MYICTHLLTLRRMLCRNILASLAPVAVVYEGGGVYFGGESSCRFATPFSACVPFLLCLYRDSKFSLRVLLTNRAPADPSSGR